MLKKIYLLSIIMSASTAAFGMSSDSQNQLNHIRAQMLAMRRAWNSERIHIKMAQKAAPQLYSKVKPVLEKFISDSAFTTKLNTTVSEQFDAIVNKSMPFSSVKTEFNFATFFPNVPMHEYGKKLFAAMAQKECYLVLGRKLAQQIQELEVVIQSSQQTPITFPFS